MEVTVTKNYKGRVSVRDYVVKECLDKGESLTIRHNGGTMTLTPQELRTKIVGRSPIISSKIGTSDYQLMDYDWLPDN